MVLKLTNISHLGDFVQQETYIIFSAKEACFSLGVSGAYVQTGRESGSVCRHGPRARSGPSVGCRAERALVMGGVAREWGGRDSVSSWFLVHHDNKLYHI